MRIIFAFLLSGLFSNAVAQNNFPKLAQQGSKIADLTPKNWIVIDTAIGDLNNDGNKDVALVFEANKPIKENRAYGDNDSEFISEFQKPRILAVYFLNPKTKRYTLGLQNNNFMLRAKEGGVIGEPFKQMVIADNHLKIYYEGGNDWRWKLNYEFKHSKTEWLLTQAGSTYYNINSGEMVDKLYDFMERKVTLTLGSIHNRKSENESREETLYFTDLRTMKTFKKPWTWEITKDSFL